MLRRWDETPKRVRRPERRDFAVVSSICVQPNLSKWQIEELGSRQHAFHPSVNSSYLTCNITLASGSRFPILWVTQCLLRGTRAYMEPYSTLCSATRGIGQIVSCVSRSFSIVFSTARSTYHLCSRLFVAIQQDMPFSAELRLATHLRKGSRRLRHVLVCPPPQYLTISSTKRTFATVPPRRISGPSNHIQLTTAT